MERRGKLVGMKDEGHRSGSENFRSAYRNGLRAAKKGVERCMNPYQGVRARAFTYGWNIEHTKNGNCRGCALCGKGAKKPPAFAKFVQEFETYSEDSRAVIETARVR